MKVFKTKMTNFSGYEVSGFSSLATKNVDDTFYVTENISFVNPLTRLSYIYEFLTFR